MKRTLLIGLLLAAIIAMPAVAQNMSSPAPQFISFSAGISAGYDLRDSEAVAIRTFRVDLGLFDNLIVGVERMAATNYIHLGYTINNNFGVSLGYAGGTNLVIGVFSNFIQNRSARGITHGLGVRLDYLAELSSVVPTRTITEGKLLFGIYASFGL